MELPDVEVDVEPYKIKMVEHIRQASRPERERWIADVQYNLFRLTSNQVFIDLLTDSGTNAMSDLQWAEMVKADESYAGSVSFELLRSTVEDILGYRYVLPTHQGRAAENTLFSTVLKEGHVIPGNCHFETTKAHLLRHKAKPVNCSIDAAFDTGDIDHPFKGNIDLDKLNKTLRDLPRDSIPFILITVTCNSCGGQPVSMENIRRVSEMAAKFDGIRVIFDAARFVENAYFIKTRETGYKDKDLRTIILEMFSYGTCAMMSGKKDGIVSMGGFVAMTDPDLYRAADVYNLLYEGYSTYGGMSGRDMAAMAQGLKEATGFEYAKQRIEQVKYLGEELVKFGIPVVRPIGGHAVYIDARQFLPHVPQAQFPSHALAVELYLQSGIRGFGSGSLSADRSAAMPKLELLRLAIPRRVYTKSHMDYVAMSLRRVWARREGIGQGFEIVWEAPIMRFFSVRLRRAASDVEAKGDTYGQEAAEQRLEHSFRNV